MNAFTAGNPMQHCARAKIYALAISTVVTLAAAEVLLRACHYHRYGIPFSFSEYSRCDPVLGWRGKLVSEGASPRAPRIFVLGDSFTQGVGVPEEKLYYTVLGRALGAGISAYSASGYGTLQEYLALDRYLDRVKPDLIILQVCYNDFINNSWDLERASYFNNNLLIRPYWVHGRIEYRFPRRAGGVRVFLASHSRLCSVLITRLEKARALLAQNGILHSVEGPMARGMEYPDFARSVSVTEELIGKIKRRAGATHVIAFPVDLHPPCFEQFSRIFGREKIPFIDEVPLRIREEERRGTVLKLPDGAHYNEAGHRICGEVLAEAILKNGYLVRRPPAATVRDTYGVLCYPPTPCLPAGRLPLKGEGE